MSLLSGLVVKLWMPLNDVKQTSLMVSGFQAKVLLQCPMLFKAMIETWRFRYHKSSMERGAYLI